MDEWKAKLENFENWLEKYLDMFGSGFPTIPITRDMGMDKSIEIIKECLEKQKDVYELGYYR